MNSLIIKGRLTSDPELRVTPNATEYCDFTVAVDRYMGKDKERETDFVPCRAWRQTAAFVAEYFKKGQEMLVSGEIRFDKYEKDGEKRTYSYCTANRIEFCGGRRESTEQSTGIAFSKPPQNTDFTEIQGETSDDLPF